MYELLQPINLDEINKLKKNEIAFPHIDFTSQELTRAKTTIKAAYTNIINGDAKMFLKDLNSDWEVDGDIVWQNKMLNQLQKDIFNMIDLWKTKPNAELLSKIFVYIQLWGGNTSRNFFNRNGGFNSNFNDIIYRNAVNSILIGNKDCVQTSLAELMKLNQMGISFATKHMFFWSNKMMPVYDNIIAMQVFGRTPQKRVSHYTEYLQALKSLSKDNGKRTDIIERSIFNWYDTIAGQKWFCIRKNNVKR